jgi:acyl carrier protein
MSVEDRVIKVVAEEMCLPLSKVTPGSRFQEDLGMDSLDGAECRIWLEEEFSVEIPDETAERLLTVQNVVEFIELEIKKQAELMKA